jgi:N-acetylglucosamine kinase-like BadF-type ATPase
LDSALAKSVKLLAKVDGINSPESKVINPVLASRGYKIIKECVEAIYSQSDIKISIDGSMAANETFALFKAQRHLLPKFKEYQVTSHKVLLMIQSFATLYKDLDLVSCN